MRSSECSVRVERMDFLTQRCHPILLAALILGCHNAQEPPFVTGLPGDANRLESYLTDHRLQEAAWECVKLQQNDRADSILHILKKTLESNPVEIERWAGKGIMRNYLLTFPNGVQGFFKVAGSDSSGPIRNEQAAYEIDILLGINLTPITLIRDVTIPDGSTVSGVIKCFVKAARTAENLGLKSEMKPDLLLFFDTIIANADRHLGNWMIRDDTKELFAIDHNRTFQFDLSWTWYSRMKSIRDPKSLGPVYERFRDLPVSEFRQVLKPHLSNDEIDQFLETRSIVLRYLDGIIADRPT